MFVILVDRLVNISTISLIGANNWALSLIFGLDPAIADWGNVMCNGIGGVGSTMILYLCLLVN